MYNTAIHDHDSTITIRPARAEDAEAVRRLAELDSTPMPEGHVLVAVVGEELRAAVSTATGEPISDPFLPSAEVVGLLSERAAQLRPGRRVRFLSRLRRRRRRRPASLAPQPAGTLRALD